MIKETIKNITRKIILGLIAVLIISLPLFAFYEAYVYTNAEQMKKDKEEYNNGICTECGGHYDFSGMSDSINRGTYYSYTCGGCGHTIITEHIMK